MKGKKYFNALLKTRKVDVFRGVNLRVEEKV